MEKNTTYSPKVQWLKEYRAMWQKVEHTRREILRRRSIAEKITPTFSAVPSRFYSDGNRIERSAEAIDTLCLQLAARRSALAERRLAMERAICSVPEERLQTLLRYRYIDGLTFAAISSEMDLSDKWVYRQHKKALDLIQIDGVPERGPNAGKSPEKRTIADNNGQKGHDQTTENYRQNRNRQATRPHSC